MKHEKNGVERKKAHACSVFQVSYFRSLRQAGQCMHQQHHLTAAISHDVEKRHLFVFTFYCVHFLSKLSN